ncbi:MAG: cation diffusion facilitator family transporter [Trichlorobacter sp.]|uniref:cation diffusion facilitator family transporter n=1 Tax=Trichlorobacter sp. TaxID=2911007 RepID=UPI00255DC0B2|nr:cation diffusion facilitator family transporter [Trichlorobacter sp.]
MTTLDSHISGKFKIAIALTAVTLVAEVAGGLWTNSLALLSDAAHVFLDLFALVLSLAAVQLAGMPTSERHTFGFHRFEIFASFINGLTVFLMGVVILYEAWVRFASPQTVKSGPMLMIAVIGLVMNLLAAKTLHSHSHDDLNVKSAFLHVVGDAAASVGVILGGVVMYYTDWYQLDALISAGIGLLILGGAGRLLRDSVHILMEGTPRGMDAAEVATVIRSAEGVQDIHHLNIWSVCSHVTALSVHIDLKPDYEGKRNSILHEIEHMLERDFHITHTTIQLECSHCNGGPLIKPLQHRARHTSDHGH